MSDLFSEMSEGMNMMDGDVWTSTGAIEAAFSSEQCLLLNSKTFISQEDYSQQLPDFGVLQDLNSGDYFSNNNLTLPDSEECLQLAQLVDADLAAPQDQPLAEQQYNPLQQQLQYEVKPDGLVDCLPYRELALDQSLQGGQLLQQNQQVQADVKPTTSLQCTLLPPASVQFTQVQSPCSEDKESSKDKPKAGGKTRRRKPTQHKVKLYERTEPFSDEEEEKKRRNAVKAFNNRQKKSSTMKQLIDKNDSLNKQLQKKDTIIQELQAKICTLTETKDSTATNLRMIKLELAKVIGFMAQN